MHSAEAVSLLLIALGAFFVPLFSGRIRIPAAVGEMLFGIAVGPALLGWFKPSSFTTFLAEFGFAFLMFLAGLEIDFAALERRGRGGLIRATLAAGLVNVVALGLTLVTGYPLYLFVAFGAISMGLLLVTLSESGQARTQSGQTVILTGSVGEFLTIVLLTGLGFYYRFGLGTRLVTEMAKLGVILVAAYVMLKLLRTIIWWYPKRFARMVATHDPSEVGVRAGMATMLIFVALASLMGVKPILGAFVAGALFSAVFREKGILETKLSSIGFGFFIPIFFIWVGAEFDVAAVLQWEVLPTMGVLIGLSMVAKAIGVLPLLSRDFTWRDGLGAALLLSCPLTLLVVIARIGREIGVITSATAAALVLLAMVSGVVFPAAYKLLQQPTPVGPGR